MTIEFPHNEYDDYFSSNKKNSSNTEDNYWNLLSTLGQDSRIPVQEMITDVISLNTVETLQISDVRNINNEDLAKGGNSGGGSDKGGNKGGTDSGGDPILTQYVSGSADGSGYNVVINFKGSWTVDLQQDFIDSSEFLSDIILGDLQDVLYRGQIIDDIQIDATLKDIDGTGGILGQAGATAIRTSNSLPATAIMEFDIADAAHFDSLGLWKDIVLHEMTHSIGFSAGIWERIGDLISGNNTDNPLFTGANATSVYESTYGLNNTSGVPLEYGEGPGTDYSHWDEDIFDNELMTGYIDGINDYSDMTIAALEDMGYDTVWV